MTNSNIIFNAALAHGFTEEELTRMMEQRHGDLPFHTAAEWSMRGYQVQKDAAPLFECYLWKHTNKPSRATIEAAAETGEEAPKQSPHFYQKLSYIYGPAQVERTPAAPDLATLKARLDALPGLTYKVKGEKTGSPNVWLSGDVEAHAETIKALGGIWSKKRSAYWIKPSTAPAEDKPAPAPAPEASAQPAGPAPAPVPGPWKKCSFYTIRRDEKTDRPTAQQVDGYTDGVYNYYAIGTTSKQWHAIHSVYGLSVAYANTRQAAQARALELTEMVRVMETKKDARLIAYADMMKAAQDGGNLSLF